MFAAKLPSAAPRDPRARRASGVLLGFAAVTLIAGCTSATPEPLPTPSEELAPVSAVDHASGVQDSPVTVNVDGGEDGVEVTFREITLQPGASTGEHCHYGQLVAVVQEGTLTHYAPVYDGGVHVYETGDSIIEGSGYVHEGRNEGDDNVVLWVTYITPDGKPLAETELAHCDS